MSWWTDIHADALAVKLAGVAGAVVSMRFLTGTIPQRLFTALGGVLLSYYAAPVLAVKIGLPEGLAGFLLGLFGMAILSRFWEWVQSTPVGAIWEIVLDWFRKRGAK